MLEAIGKAGLTGRAGRLHRARRRVERAVGRRRPLRVQEVRRARPHVRADDRALRGLAAPVSDRLDRGRPRRRRLGRLASADARARRPRAARRRRHVRHQPGDPEARHRRRRRQRAAGQAESDRHRHRNARRHARWRATPATRRSSRTAPARPRTRRSPISPSAPRPARSRPDRRAAPIASANTTSCCASKRSSAPRATFAGTERHQADLRTTMHQARPAAPRRKHLEQGEPVHRLDRRRPVRPGPRRSATKPAGCCARAGYAFDLAYTSVLKRAIRTLWIALDALDLMWIPVDQELAAERAALRRAAGAEQGGNRGEARRGAGQDLAAQLRHPAAAARRPTTRATRRAIRATRRSTPAELPLTESLKDTVARFLPVLARDDRAGDPGRQARAHRRARQQPARAREVPRRRLRLGDRRAEHPDRHPARLRAGRRPEADPPLLPGRSGAAAAAAARVAASAETQNAERRTKNEKAGAPRAAGLVSSYVLRSTV